MNHNEAVEQMATERYLLDELTPDLRDAFEEHMFDCPECALDVRTAAAFVQEAKTQLPELTGHGAPSPASSPVKAKPTTPKTKNSWWFQMWRPIFANPAFAAPAFAALLLIVGYQNLVTYPALRMAANEPHIAHTVFLHSGARGAAHTQVDVDRKQGTALLIDTPQPNGSVSFLFELRDAQGKLALSATTPQSSGQESGSADGTLSLAIPGAGIEDGAYTLIVSGVAANGERSEIERHILDFHVRN